MKMVSLLSVDSLLNALPVLALGLEKTAKWEQRDRGLWLCTEYWPPKRDLSKRHLPPPAHPSLSPAQREEAIRLLQEPGMSLRKVANILGVSRETIHRLAQQEGIELQTSQKLTPEQREEAFNLLDIGMSLRLFLLKNGLPYCVALLRIGSRSAKSQEIMRCRMRLSGVWSVKRRSRK